MRELTNDERQAMMQVMNKAIDERDTPFTGSRLGFIAGIDYQGARITQLERQLNAYRAYAAGQITWGELEEMIK